MVDINDQHLRMRRALQDIAKLDNSKYAKDIAELCLKYLQEEDDEDSR